MTLARNIFLARKAIDYVNIKVGMISPNKFNPVTRANVYNRIQFDNELAYIRRVVYSKLYLTLSDSLNRTTGNPIQPATWNREAVICDPWCQNPTQYKTIVIIFLSKEIYF
ncbi:hypothetical protein [Xenorhabdus littoralis]|uniref:hypothetical protein n=1 Tax=Xenorhabdus littoralis TaxID=2582835 RepID=UPI0029E7FCA4|nr:hypothetical protein [Xenorhabdus sp. psl]MDX7992826.1 hypothetical protein [Xenorhabdus sp. psl]